MGVLIDSETKRIKTSYFILLFVEFLFFLLFLFAEYEYDFQGNFVVNIFLTISVAVIIVTAIIYFNKMTSLKKSPINLNNDYLNQQNEIIESIEEDYKNSKAIVISDSTKTIRIQNKWVIISKAFSTIYKTKNEILWVYKIKTDRKINGIFIGSWYSLYIVFKDRPALKIGADSSYIDKVIGRLYEQMPWIEIGFSEALKSKHDSSNLLNQYQSIQKRKMQMLDAYNDLIKNPSLTDDELINRGQEKLNSNEFTSSKIYFSQAIEKGNTNIFSYYKRGFSKYKLEEYKSAIDDFNIYLGTSTKDYDAYFFRGTSYYFIGEFKYSLADLNKAIEINEKHALSFLFRGVCRLKFNDKAGACKDWKMSKELGCDKADGYLEKYCK